MSRKEPDDSHIKRMADLLRQGATLADLACPACASPLFRLKNGDLWCEKCKKKVIVVKEGEETKLAKSSALESLETSLLAKVQEMQAKMEKEQDPAELQKLGATLTGLLESLEKTRKIRKS